MGASPTPRSADAGPVVAVACSGGVDSLALLHATAHAARGAGVHVAALHVHHGLMAEADAWADALVRTVRRWAARGLPVSCHLHRLSERPARGDSVEAWARRQRYAALAAMAREQGAPIVLLAHHRRDQAETVLLQALRGAGAAGLAAMPAEIEREGLLWARPWLDQPRAAIEAYARRHRLRAVEDASNADPRFDRSRLRRAVWPALTAAFPQAEAALAAVAAQAAQADALAREVAQADLLTLAVGDELDLLAWQASPPARRVNALKAWLALRLPAGAPQALLDRLLTELPAAPRGGARWPAGQGVWVRAYRGRLTVGATGVSPATVAAAAPYDRSLGSSLDLSRPGRHPLPAWGGALEVSAVRARAAPSVPAAWLRQAELRPRSGGERFQLAPGGLPRALKKQFQASGVPEWAREGPLLWVGGQLVFVPGLGIDARCWHAAGGPRRSLRWVPG